jgi:hyperosmotically inducible protein
MKTQNLTILILIAALPVALLATPSPDHKIEDTAKASYNYRPVLNNDVTGHAKDGVVTLTGKVEDQDAKFLANDTVENFPGITGVKNDLTHKSTYPEKSDDWIAFKMGGLLGVKGNVSATSTDVAVKAGIVTLTGTADNIAQKELTGIYAGETDGVKSVENNIVVSDKPSTTEKIAETIDDASITSQVKYALLSHKSTRMLSTKVTNNDGLIVITGVAHSAAERSLVTKLAKDVRGTKSVNNKMTIKS